MAPIKWSNLRKKDWFKIAVMTVVLIALGLMVDWNENRSPWGRSFQAEKLAHLKATICNKD